uniref:t-SNARE coiled-coil homology domain-containing protein n=1 Tax=Rhodosorus marinus TaxID=101924 RepID=A0A7S0BLX1_9RHOD|mmetsp:Transcript_20414/g.29624  ORF Transcript_20414/g.29624 Transcript_20414/m.29624 type:complete len:299 (+) Transcript_20414:56-952(+)
MTDRLAELKQDAEPEVATGSYDDVDEEYEVEQSEMLKRFNREAEAIDTALGKIDASVQYLDQQAETGDLDEAKAQHVLAQCKTKCEAVRTRLKRIADENKDLKEKVLSGDDSLSAGEVQIRIQQSQKLAEKFRDTTQSLEAGDERQNQRSTAAIYSEIRDVNPDATDEEIKEAIETNDFRTILGSEQVALQKTELAQRVEELQERNTALQSLEQDVVQLHQMFMDMQILVENQGELLNQIDYNVQKTRHNAEVAVEEIEEARRLQLSARKKKMCIIIIVVVICLIILFAILGPLVFNQ